MSYQEISTIAEVRTRPPLQTPTGLETALGSACKLLMSQQTEEGYWWYTLEANEAIGAEFIQLMHFLDAVDEDIQKGLINRIISEQREDGSWGIYYGAPGDISIGIECYFVLKLAGFATDHPVMVKARDFILSKGGLTQARVFTRIHLALFGLVPWSACPAMPVQFMLLPKWAPVNIYEFSSWARASIVPLLVIMSKQPIKKLPNNFNIDELYSEPPEKRAFGFKAEKTFISWANSLIQLDKFFKVCQHLPVNPLKSKAISKAIKWMDEHVNQTEDIYPALAYAAMAYKTMDYPTDSPELQRCLNALKGFQHGYEGGLSCVPMSNQKPVTSNQRSETSNLKTGSGNWLLESGYSLHQQCCISPVWDTPWAIMAMLESGIKNDHPALLKAGRWLISKQILFKNGDWRIKNPHGEPGGWSFEFKNDFYPDTDDTIEVLSVLHRLAIPEREKSRACQRGLNWLLSMQNDDGGWAAFDKNNNLEIVNKIPFSDHGACLDPSSPDITGRMIEFLAAIGFKKDEDTVRRAIDYIKKTQEPFGGWFGRWGINYIYGTWAVLTGLAAIGEDLNQEYIQKAARWLKSIQNADGGWSESPESYVKKQFVPCPESVPSQTAWALMGLIAVGEPKSVEVQRGADWLIKNQNQSGSWDEKYHTGTGFPGHFYIRYHGYRHFFPTLALGRYRKTL